MRTTKAEGTNGEASASHNAESPKLSRLLSFLRPYWFWVALAPLAMLLETSMDLAQPALMQQIIDNGVGKGDQELIYATGFKMLLYALLGACGGIACTFFSSQAATGLGNSLRKALFTKIQRLSFAQTDRFTAGSLTTRMTDDISTLQFLTSMATRMILRSPFLLIGSIYLVLKTDWRIALPLLLSAPLLSWTVVHCMKKLIPLFRERQQRTDKLSSTMQETLIGIRVVKAFANEEGENKRFEERNLALADTGIKAGMIHATLGPMLGLIQQLSTVAIVFVAAREANMGLIKAGQIAAIVNWTSQVMGSLIMLSFEAMHFSRALISARRVAEVLYTEPEVKDGPCTTPPATGKIRFDNVSFAYPNSSGDRVLQNISFSVEPGEHLAIIGATGSGKTSLLNLIARFYDPQEGEIFIDDTPLRSYSLAALRSSMGIVLQNPRLFVGTVEENIRWGNENASDEEVRRVAKIVQAHDFIQNFSDGYQTNIAQGGVSLSGGQKQRIAIARAIIRKPKLLILDDSTSAIDPATERALRRELHSVSQGVTVLTVAQRASSIRDADRILVLDQGNIVGCDSHEALMSDCPVYREIIHSQSVSQETLHQEED